MDTKRKASLFVGLAALCVFGVQARADSIFVATLNGDSEAPGSAGSGYATVDYSPTANDITYTLSFQNLSSDATMSHIHSGPPGTEGPILIWFFPPSLTPTPTATSGTYSGTWTAADLSAETQDPAITNFTELLSAMTSGDTYVNVHSVDYPGGEIRGQLTMLPEASTLALVSLPFLLFGGAAIWRKRRGQAR
jgi:hypothetical protein